LQPLCLADFRKIQARTTEKELRKPCGICMVQKASC
jgi:hypothetical protein